MAGKQKNRAERFEKEIGLEDVRCQQIDPFPVSLSDCCQHSGFFSLNVFIQLSLYTSFVSGIYLFATEVFCYFFPEVTLVYNII